MKKIILFAICACVFASTSLAQTYKVALFSPKATSPFWTLMVNFAEEAATDLGMEFRLYDAKMNQFEMKNQLEKAVSGPDKADAVVFSNFKTLGPTFINIADKAGVTAFLFNSGLDEKQSKLVGNPREKYKHWIGEMLPDDEGTSTSIVNYLIEEAKSQKKVASDGKVHVIGISGIISDAASVVRVNGLKKAFLKQGRADATLLQVVASDYSKEQGKNKFLRLMNRYPEATVVWSASYRSANGILEGIKEKNLVSGKDIFVNTYVLNAHALNAVKSGAFTVTAGGHYIEGAWVMVLLYDYFHGIDFVKTGTRMKSPMGVITKKNVDLYLKKITKKKFLKDNIKRVDFTQYSKKYHPDLKQYQFDFDSVLEQL